MRYRLAHQVLAKITAESYYYACDTILIYFLLFRTPHCKLDLVPAAAVRGWLDDRTEVRLDHHVPDSHADASRAELDWPGLQAHVHDRVPHDVVDGEADLTCKAKACHGI